MSQSKLMTVLPISAAIPAATVDFPAPVHPVTTTRRGLLVISWGLSIGSIAALALPREVRSSYRHSMSNAKIAGLNHVTLAVSDLERSLAFYQDLLGLRLRARWREGTYLEAGSLWLCLSLDSAARTSPHLDYTHSAFDVAAEDFEELAGRVRAVANLWKEDRSEGSSLYFLDPDGHKLELHVGSLGTRLANYDANPIPGRTLYD